MKEYKEAEEFSKKDLASWPRNTLPGAQMRQRECRDLMAKIEGLYSDVLRAGAFTMFPLVEDGKPETLEQFLRAVRETANPLVFSARTLYQKLADDIEPTLGDRRTFGITQVVRLVTLLTDLGRDLGFRNIPLPQQLDMVHCSTGDDLVAHVRLLVRSMNGDALNRAYIESEIVKRALSIRYTRSIVPVVITDATQSEVDGLGTALFSGSYFPVPLTLEQTDNENVLKILSDIKKSIKK